MTVKELSQLYWLRREIAHDEERLRELRARSTSLSSPDYSGDRVKGGSVDSAIERIVIQIVELEARIQEKRDRCVTERLRLEEYIAGIDDSLTRQIFVLRFSECNTWEKTATLIGGMNSESGIRQIVYRYLKKHPD